jgi:SAM-dependent methyltransferase
LEILRGLFKKTVAVRDVFEIACGTGYWTAMAAESAKSITATDVNQEVLDIAAAKKYGCPVTFQKVDAFKLALPPKAFNAAIAAAWWSHLKKSEIRNFISQFHQQFAPGTIIAFMDNRFVPGSSTPINRSDDEGNTYQLRKLDDESEYEVLKNFPDEDEARQAIGEAASGFSWTELPYYWFLTYKLK